MEAKMKLPNTNEIIVITGSKESVMQAIFLIDIGIQKMLEQTQRRSAQLPLDSETNHITIN